MNRMLKKTLLVTGLVATLGFGASANADVVDLFIDPNNFTDNTVTDTTLGGGGSFDEYGNFPATILGGYRDLFVEVTAQGFGPTNSTLTAGVGSLSFSNAAGTTGVGTVQWDGNDNSPNLDLDGLGGADLITQTGCPVSGCNQFVATVVFADLGFGYSITVADMDGRISTLYSLSVDQIPPSPAEDAVYLFEWFSRDSGNYFELGLPFTIVRSGADQTGDIDFSDIGALQFQINAAGNPVLGGVPQTVSVDLTLTGITKRGEVPEPGTLALLGLALTGLAGLRRRTKK